MEFGEGLARPVERHVLQDVGGVDCVECSAGEGKIGRGGAGETGLGSAEGKGEGGPGVVNTDVAAAGEPVAPIPQE